MQYDNNYIVALSPKKKQIALRLLPRNSSMEKKRLLPVFKKLTRSNLLSVT